MIYQIKIKGELDKSWRDWLGDVEITLDLASYGSVTTTLTIDATDQPVLFGVLDRIRDLNLVLISVTNDDDLDDTVPLLSDGED